MSAFFSGLGRFVVRFRWPIVVGWLLGAIVFVGMLPSLGSQVNNDNAKFLAGSSPSIRAQNLLKPILGSTYSNQLVVVAVRDRGILNAADQTAVASDAAAISRLGGVTRVRDLGVSQDGAAAQILVNAKLSNFGMEQAQSLLARVTATFPHVGALPGLHFHLAGALATDVANNRDSKAGANSTQRFSVLLILILLFVIFRSVLAPIVTLLPAGLVLAISGGIIGALGRAGIVNVSQFTQLLLIVLILGAGTDYGLFLVFRVREEIGRGLEPRDAVALAVHRVGESISASAGTVIFALLTLLMASFGIYHDLGIPLAIGIGTMLAAGLTFLPAALAILGRAVFWPSKVKIGTERRNRWGAIAGRLIRRPAVTLVAGVLVFGVMAGAIWNFKAGGFGGATHAPHGTDAAAGNSAVTLHFPQASADPTNLVFVLATPVWANTTALAQAQDRLAGSGLFTTLQGPLDPTGDSSMSPTHLSSLHQEIGASRGLPPIEPASLQETVNASDYNLYRATSNYISADGRTIQFQAGLEAGDSASSQAISAIPPIRATVASIAAHIGAKDSGVAGQASGLYDVSSTSNADLTHIIPIAVLAIALLLGLVLRSAIAPTYLIVSVVLSYLAAMGLCVFIFIDLNGDAGLTFLLPFLMFIFLLALGEDYNILIMSRIREEAHHLPLREAVVKAVGATGSTITSAGLVLAGSFSVLALAAGSGPSSDQVRAIGFGIAAGILMDTFVVRTVLVPATVALLGKWNWWPSHLVTVSDAHEADAVARRRTMDMGDLGPMEISAPAVHDDPDADLETTH